MASHLDSDTVQYVCDCGRPNRINKLFFCRHCLKLRCGRCACTQVDSFFCSSCLENIPSAEAKFAGNRCTKCYDCPSCQHTLTSRAAKPPPVVSVVSAEGAGGGDAVAAPTASSEKDASKRKVYYLMCSACRWTSRDVGIPDRPVATGQWPDLEYAHATRFASLLEHCKNVVLHDKQAAQDWARRKGPGQQKYGSLTDRTGLTVAIARRTLGWTDKTAPKRIARPAAIKPSVATADVPALPAELLVQHLDLYNVTTLRQRLNLPATQPHTVDGMHPAHKSLSIKRSVRCGQCEHYVIKPEFNPTSIKYRIHSLASGHVPVVRLMPPATVPIGADETVAVRVKFINPTAHDMRIVLRAAPQSAEGDKANDEHETNDNDAVDITKKWAVLQLPAASAATDDASITFVVQRRDDSTEFDGDTALPDEPEYVLWRRSNAVVVELRVRTSATARSGDAINVALCLGHNYVNAYPGATSAAVASTTIAGSSVAGVTTATAAMSLDGSNKTGSTADSAGPVEQALTSRVHLRVGCVQ